MHFFIDLVEHIVTVDGVTVGWDLSEYDVPGNVSTFEWLGESGIVTFKGDKEPEETRNYTRYQPILDDFEKQKEFALSPVADNEQKRYQRLVAQRDKHLDETDWMVMRENERRIMKTNRFLSDKDFFELLTYRDDLRKLPQYYTHSNDWVWPKVPQCVIRARNPERVKPEQAPVV